MHNAHPLPDMKTTYLSVLAMSLLLSPGICATITILPATPYRSLNDSPWRNAIFAGDALKFGDQFCNSPAPTLPDGLGVHDDFEDDDCQSPWLSIATGQTRAGGSVDADDGFLNESPNGDSLWSDFVDARQRLETRLEFITTSDGKYPLWFGYAVTFAGSPQFIDGTIIMDILGANNSTLASVNLYTLLGGEINGQLVRDDVFLGFVSDEPVRAIYIYNDGIIIDHFQYGYGTQPIPEPAASVLAAFAVVAAGRRRRAR